jgi:GT2 family glycosyltransferase
MYIIIAVFNRKEITLNCISLLKQQTFSSFEIVVVDDNSIDGTSEEIAKKYPEVHIIKGTGEWWWTKSMNEGIKFALNRRAELILFMNNDTIINKDYVETLLHQHYQHPWSVIGSIDVTHRDNRIFFSGISKINWFTLKATQYHHGYVKYSPEISGLHKTIALNGRGTLVPRKVFETVGLLDEKKLPQYASDFDFTLRTHKEGFPVLISWDAVVYSIVEETGEGKPYIKQSFLKFLKSFTNKYSQTSISTWYNYLRKYTAWYYLPIALPLQFLKLIYSYFKRRKAFY